MTKKYAKTHLKEVEDKGDRILRFVASTSDVDRSGDVIDQNGWEFDNFEDNPVFLANHDYNRLPVGKIIDWEVVEDKFLIDVKFPDPKEFDDPSEEVKFSNTVYQMYRLGYLNAVSVGFIPLKSKPRKEGGTHFQRQSLLEVSAVTVPDNPQATMERAVSNDHKALVESYMQKIRTWINKEGQQLNKRNREHTKEIIRRAAQMLSSTGSKPETVLEELAEESKMHDQPILKQLNEDTEAELRGILEQIEDRHNMIRDLIGQDEFNQDSEDEVVAMLQANADAYNVALDVLGVGEPDEEDQGQDPEEDAAPGTLEVGDIVDFDGGVGVIEQIVQQGVLDVPDADNLENVTEADPAALVRVYEESDEGIRPTDEFRGFLFSELEYVDPESIEILQEESKEVDETTYVLELDDLKPESKYDEDTYIFYTE